jgi:hypothetical protein
MMLALRLRKTVEEILQMSTLERDLWAGYFLYEYKEDKKKMNKQQPAPRRRR